MPGPGVAANTSAATRKTGNRWLSTMGPFYRFQLALRLAAYGCTVRYDDAFPFAAFSTFCEAGSSTPMETECNTAQPAIYDAQWTYETLFANLASFCIACGGMESPRASRPAAITLCGFHYRHHGKHRNGEDRCGRPAAVRRAGGSSSQAHRPRGEGPHE